MIRTVLFNVLLLISLCSRGESFPVKNIEELRKANASAAAGDTIILQNGEWNNINISLNCHGTKEQPIIVKAETPGLVLITGKSSLNIGGSYIQVEGLYFSNGFAGDDAVIKFCIDKKQIANNCRVTQTVINDFNNPKRLDENYWVALYGKNNRLDHCSFLNKKNIGVLLAVILEDERSRENYHSIDHNYFGVRIPLASNGGEIIRVGVSQHCEFNSNTIITDNFFEQCDGEGEIISIKSGSNIIRNNLFKECQGSVVLRHGDNNTVENNVFLGNNKRGTGGVRIINKGQWVINNFFYKCTGEGFRSPLSIMNGVPNSPANRYVPVSDAVIAYNTWADCSPVSLCEGSDTERSVPPAKVNFLSNLFYSGKSIPLSIIHDDISGINFAGNVTGQLFKVNIPVGFETGVTIQPKSSILPIAPENIGIKYSLPDTLKKLSLARVSIPLTSQPGFSDAKRLTAIQNNATNGCGAKWYNPNKTRISVQKIKKDCKNAEEITALLASVKDASLVINLTGTDYQFSTPLNITSSIEMISSKKSHIRFSLIPANSDFLFQLMAGNSLHMKNLSLNLSGLKARDFIRTDATGNSRHSNFTMDNCNISTFNGTFFAAAKSSVCDSIVISNSSFADGLGLLFDFTGENDQKGYYNVEKLVFFNNSFFNHSGQMLAMMRGGNDESTMGPQLLFLKNRLTNCTTKSEVPLIHLYGTQASLMESNRFTNCNTGHSLILFQDAVRAKHQWINNKLTGSGKIITNKYVVDEHEKKL